MHGVAAAAGRSLALNPSGQSGSSSPSPAPDRARHRSTGRRGSVCLGVEPGHWLGWVFAGESAPFSRWLLVLPNSGGAGSQRTSFSIARWRKLIEQLGEISPIGGAGRPREESSGAPAKIGPACRQAQFGQVFAVSRVAKAMVGVAQEKLYTRGFPGRLSLLRSSRRQRRPLLFVAERRTWAVRCGPARGGQATSVWVARWGFLPASTGCATTPLSRLGDLS